MRTIIVVKDYKDYKGSATFEGVQPMNFGHWNYIFERCLGDLTESKDPLDILMLFRVKRETKFGEMVGCTQEGHEIVQTHIL